MANKTVALLWYCKTEKGWRRFPVVLGKNNRIKPGIVLVDGVQAHYPTGRYELRFYKGSKPVYKSAGNNAADALMAQKKQESLLQVHISALTAEVKVPETQGRVYIRRKALEFIKDAEQRQATEAPEMNRSVTDEFMDVTGLTFMDEITKEHVYRFHKALRDRGCGARTVANKHNRLKSFLKFAKLDYKEILPPTPKYDLTLPTIYTQEQCGDILKAADEYMRLVIEIMLQCGLRDQELMHLEWTDIRWDESALRVTSKPHWGFKIKDSEERDVPFGPDLLASLRKRQADHPKSRLVVPTDADKPNGKLLRLLKRLAKQAGLNCGVCEGCHSTLGECQAWTLHKFRRTFCTTYLRSGIDMRSTQHFMGHSDIASTMRYLKPATTKESQAKISSIKWV